LEPVTAEPAAPAGPVSQAEREEET
jgi:hypothetical protein